MIRSLGLSLLILFLASSANARQFADVKVQKINDRVYALLGGIDAPNRENGGYVNNVLVILGDQGTILVDAGSHKSIARHINQSIEKITPKPVTHILVTHHHGDHHLGASFFSGAQVIASEYCATQIKDNGRGLVQNMSRMTGLNLGDTSAVTPHQRIPQRTRQPMVIHGVKLELITPDTAHTHGDMMVFLPDDGVLAAGDILVHGVNPNTADGHLGKWLGVMDEIRKLPASTIMPGHGALMEQKDVAEFQQLMTGFYRTIEQLYKAGGDMSEVRQKLDLAQWQKLSRFEDMMGRNISKVWLEVEADNF